MAQDFEQLPHTADLKIRAFGKNVPELFKNALIGMFQVIRPIAPGCSYQHDRLVCPTLPEHRTIEVTSIDTAALLIDFLSEALYLSDTYNEAYLDVTILKFQTTTIHAILHGIKITGFEVVEIKAVTYHDVRLQQVHGVWQADIVFDI